MEQCPIEYTLSMINGKWKIIILKELSKDSVRYGELMRRVSKITPKVLIQHLRDMENDGLINRHIFPEVPPRVEYSLTEKGESLFSIFLELRRWGLGEKKDENIHCKMCDKCVPHIIK